VTLLKLAFQSLVKKYFNTIQLITMITIVFFIKLFEYHIYIYKFNLF